MNVGELIARLKDFPLDLPVLTDAYLEAGCVVAAGEVKEPIHGVELITSLEELMSLEELG